MEIGNKIKKIRELKNFTQDYMAKGLSMTSAGYGKIERNETEVSFQKLEKIAELFGVKVEDIINFDERIVFNQMNNKNATAGYIINQNREQEKKLYEQMLEQLKQENLYLKSIIEILQSQLNK